MNAWSWLRRVREDHFERHEFSIISHAALNIIRTVKLFAWEPKVKSQIDGRRAKELKLIRKGEPSATTVHNITYTRRPFDRNSRIYCTVAAARNDDDLHLCHLCKIVRRCLNSLLTSPLDHIHETKPVRFAPTRLFSIEYHLKEYP